MKLDIVLNALAIILFLGFSMACVIIFSMIDKQKEITVYSRYGRGTEPLDILYVNIGLILIAVMIVFHSYRFLPALVVFLIWLICNSRTKSGIAPDGIFIGSTHLGWKEIKGYRIVNDEISTIKVLVYCNDKCYVLRCDKSSKAEVDSYFVHNGIVKKEKSKGE